MPYRATTFADMEAAAHAIARGLPYTIAARAAGVDERTIRRWRKESPDFSRALDAAILARRYSDAEEFAAGYEPLRSK